MRLRLAAVGAIAALLLGACGDDAQAKVGLYDRVPVPAVPDRTEAIDPALTSGGADGQYWAELADGSAAAPEVLTFRLTQAFFAATCFEELGEDDCPNDYGTLDEPSRDVDVVLADLAILTVVAENQQNYAVTADELFALSGGAAASPEAPEGYEYVEYPFLLTMRDGKVIEAHQVWVP